MFKLSGLIAATMTAFNADGSINLDPIAKHAELLARNNVDGIFVCGSTGEGVSMSTDERKRVLKRWSDVARKHMTVIAHVGHNSLTDARDLAAHAQKSKVHAIATVAPSVLRPSRLEDLVAWCAEVAAAAPETPYFYYHIPVLTNVRFDMLKYAEMARSRIPTFCGIKFTDENIMEFANCAEAGINMLFGRDEILLSGLVAGAHGAIGSTFNYSAPIYARVMAAYAMGDIATAQREMTRARNCVRILADNGGLRAGKQMLKMCGIDCGPVRLPQHSMTNDQVKAMRKQLDAIGFDDLRCK